MILNGSKEVREFIYFCSNTQIELETIEKLLILRKINLFIYSKNKLLVTC